MIIRVMGFVFIVLLAYYMFSKAGPAIETLRAAEISELLKKTNEFDGQRVTVTGTVLRGASILGLGGFTIEQNGAEIFVVTSRGTPELRSQVTVSGTFKQAIAVDGLRVAVIFEKK